MKLKLSWHAFHLLLALGLVVLLSLSAGCGGSGRKAPGSWSLLVTETNVVEQVSSVPATTNVIHLVTNIVARVNGSIVTNWVTNVVHAVTPGVETTNLITNIVFLPNPKIQNLIGGAKTVNDFANPTPFAPAVNGFLGLASAALAWFARVKTKQAKEASTMVDTLIQGVEFAKSPEVKASIKSIAEAAGIQGKLHALVKSKT